MYADTRKYIENYKDFRLYIFFFSDITQIQFPTVL